LNSAPPELTITCGSLVAMSDVELNSIQSISIETYRDALVFCDRPTPTTELQAKFSLQHALACVMVHQSPALEHFHEGVLSADLYRHWRDKIQVSCSESIEANYPQQFGAKVSLLFADGKQRRVQLLHAWGDPAWPLQNSDVINKAETLFAAAGLSSAEASAISEGVLKLNESENLQGLSQLLSAPQIRGRARE